MSTKKKWSIGLFILQAIALIGTIAGEGYIIFTNIGGFIGFFIPSIIAIFLLYSDYKENNAQSNNENLKEFFVLKEEDKKELKIELEHIENKLKEDYTQLIEELTTHVSLFSGIPIYKMNKEKIKKEVADFIEKSQSIRDLPSAMPNEKNISEIIWMVAKEGNQLKEKKLSECAPNSKVKIKFMQILKENAEKLNKVFDINISEETIKEASEPISLYIDKFIFSPPTSKHEQDITLPLILMGLMQEDNIEKIVSKLGNEFYENFIKSALAYLFCYSEMLDTDLLTPNSPKYITALNNVNYYLNILTNKS